MEIKMTLLENAYDFLNSSLELAQIAGEDGTHDISMCDTRKKAKWKAAYIELVQSIELIVKVGLSKTLNILVYDNIDKTIDASSKTISGSKGIDRLCNCYPALLLDSEKIFIKRAIEIRNQYIHGEVVLDSASLKPTYCKLYSLFLKINNYFNENDNSIFKEILSRNHTIHDNLLYYKEHLIIFRDNEMTPKDQAQLTKEIREQEKFNYFIDEKGITYKRIKYGEETPHITSSYCPDCLASKGEYHLESCDIEICPKCHHQLLSCNCDLKLYSIGEEAL